MTLHICIFGDSMVSDQYCYGFQMWSTILKEKIGDNFSLFNMGISGNTTKNLLKRIETEILSRKPKIIIIMIGTNDSGYSGKNDESCVVTPIDEFRENIHQLIKISKKYTNQILFVGLPPVDEQKTAPFDNEDESYYANKSIKKYNDAINSICKNKNISFIKIYEKWIKADYAKFLLDGLHPSKEGNKKIFEEVWTFLKRKKMI